MSARRAEPAASSLPADMPVDEVAALTDAGISKYRNRIVGHGEVAPSQLLAHPKNWRLHPREQQDALSGVLEAVGWVQSVIVSRGSGLIIDGHLRVTLAMRENEHTPIPVVYVDLSDEEEALILATFDPISQKAGTDATLLHELIADIGKSDALASLLGAQSPVNELLSELASKHHVPRVVADPDEIPETPVEPIAKRGDLWLLGSHRLLCGDATIAADVMRLMNGERAGLMNTDPPYGVGYANDDRPNPGVAKPRVAKPRVANDEFKNEELQTFLEAAFRESVAGALTKNAAWYLWHAHLTQGFFAAAAAAAAAAADVLLHRQIIWIKPVLLLTRGHYHWKHEPCFMGWVRGHEPPDYGLGAGERTQTTVWEVASVSRDDRKEFDHSTPKPVALFATPILKHLRVGEIAYDPFAGTGPQFIAAEMHERRCYGIEIEPKFCDVIVARWEKATGKRATLAQSET